MRYLFELLKIKPKMSACRYVKVCQLSCIGCTRKDDAPIYPKLDEYQKFHLLKILTYDNDYCVRLNNRFITWNNINMTIHDTNILGLACSVVDRLGLDSEMANKIRQFNWYGGSNEYIE